MSGVEGTEREDHDDGEAGLEKFGFRLSASGLRGLTHMGAPVK